MPETPIPQKQEAALITAAGGPEVLRLGTIPVPVPGPEEVLVEVAAAGVNRHDCNQRRAGPEYDPNLVPGLEVAGTIVALGSVVPRSRLGERAAALTQGGGYARSVATASALALPAPRSLAWFNSFDVLRLRPGERILIHGGTSGVASLANQALTGLGHEVFATGGSDCKRAAALGFGARAAFDYKHTGLANQVKAATGGRGVDVILDVSAGAHLAADLEMLAPDGRIGRLSAGGGKELGDPAADAHGQADLGYRLAPAAARPAAQGGGRRASDAGRVAADRHGRAPCDRRHLPPVRVLGGAPRHGARRAHRQDPSGGRGLMSSPAGRFGVNPEIKRRKQG